MDSLQKDIFRYLPSHAFLRDVNLEIASLLRALPKAESPIQDDTSDLTNFDEIPDVIILDIHGLNGEHAYLVNTPLPSTPRQFSYSPIQLFEDGVDRDRFAQVAKQLLDEVVEATLLKRDYILVFLASDIGGSILKTALHQASKSTDPRYSKILAKTSLMVFFGTPHRASPSHSWETTLSRLLYKLYPNRLESWPQSKLEELASLHKHIAYDFQNLGCQCRIVSYYQDNPIDAEYELISPRYPATLDWDQEVRIAAHKPHNLISDFYTPQDQRCLRELIHNIRVERQPVYKLWHSLLTKLSQAIVPLQLVHAIFREFCDWLFTSNPPFKSWAVDSLTARPSSETNDKSGLTYSNLVNDVLEKSDQALGSSSSDNYPIKHDQEYPKRPRSSVLGTSYTLSIESCDRTCNSVILHSSLVAAIQSQRHVSNLDKKDGDGKTPLIVAVEWNNLPLVKSLMAYHVNLDIRNNSGRSAIHYALKYGYFDITVHLLSHMDTRDKEKRLQIFRFLQDLTVRGHVRVLKELLDKTPPSPEIENEVEMAMRKAVQWGKLMQLDCFFLNTINVEKQTPLLAAVASGSIEIIEMLLRAGAEVNTTDSRGQTPISSAASAGHSLILSMLLRANISQDFSLQHSSKLKSLPEFAFLNGSAVVKALLEHDEQAMNVVAGSYGTVLQSAVIGGNLDMVKLLFEHGIPRENSGSPSGRYGTAIYAAVYNPENSVTHLLDSLQLQVSDFEIKDQEGRLPLHIAASRLPGEVFGILCSVYDDVKQKDFQGRTALHFAAGAGLASNVEIILRRDPELIHEADEDGWTTLHWACRSSSTSTIRLLLDKGARVTDVTKRGWLPRDVAVWHDSDDTSMVETTEYPTSSIDASILGECDVETNKRVNQAARRATWISLRTDEAGSAGCDSCDCYIYGRRYTCQICWDMDYCFKCFRHIKLLQHHKNHIFSILDLGSDKVGEINPWVCVSE
ncbi:hypothetical protein MKX08_002174 [Trichoderma sp. CBMAI-0020]|nr:hypothetical protein MKX08_002174 [Trichoderma sp. CBMAI-0020]WOD46532.1 hypothetical protein [Trichoderma atroviride]